MCISDQFLCNQFMCDQFMFMTDLSPFSHSGNSFYLHMNSLSKPCGKVRCVGIKSHNVSCSGVKEIDPQQDVLMWSKQAVFNIQLCLSPSGQLVFNPAFSQVETMAQAVLDGAVRTTFDIPRLGSQMMVAGSVSNTTGKTNSNSVPTMDMDDVELHAVRTLLFLMKFVNTSNHF
jgi:hypothetical protein